MCRLRKNLNFVLSKLLLNLLDSPFIVKTVYHVLRLSWRSFIFVCVYRVYRLSYRIVRVFYRTMRESYRIVRVSYPILRVSYRIVYHVKNNVASTVTLATTVARRRNIRSTRHCEDKKSQKCGRQPIFKPLFFRKKTQYNGKYKLWAQS
jgi:hypothetical protein